MFGLITDRSLCDRFPPKNVVQSLSRVQLFATPWTDCSMPGFPVLQYPLEFAQTHVHWVSDAIQRSHPLSPHSPDLNLSQREDLFQWVGSSHRWPKYWSFNFSISPYNEYSGLISFRIDWFGLLAVQGSLKSLLQHPSWKHQFFGAQHSSWSNSHLYMTTSKTIAFDYADLCQQSDVSAF